MKKGVTIALVVLAVVVVALALGVIEIPSGTGQATFTEGASYNAPIDYHSSNFVECAYTSEDDGWSVTDLGKMSYFDRTTGSPKETLDNCEGYRTVVEYHCLEGKLVSRMVTCPSGMYCNGGICVQ